MPYKVTGEDGRLLHDNLGDTDAQDLARTVHSNTGESVTLTPLVYDEVADAYVADPEGAKVYPAAPAEGASEPEGAAEEAVAETVADPVAEEPAVAEPVDAAPVEEAPLPPAA